MNASNAALATLATAGIDAAQTAVLVVLGALIAFAAATYGTIKVLEMFGIKVRGASGQTAGTSTASVLDAEHAEDRRTFEHEAKNNDSWGDEWSNASGTGSADISKWRY